MRRNPPWATNIITSRLTALRNRVGDALMPREDTGSGVQEHFDWKPRKPRSFVEYGCGHYGCVMPTNTEGVVVKVTTDPTEAAFVAAYLSLPRKERPVGIVPYHRILVVPNTKHRNRPVFLIWRDEAQFVGSDQIERWIRAHPRENDREYYGRSYNKTERSLLAARDQASAIRRIVGRKPNAAALLHAGMEQRDRAWEIGPAALRYRSVPLRLGWHLYAFEEATTDMQSEPMGAYLGTALRDSLVYAGFILADVHVNNIGMPTGEVLDEIGMTPIITDPGHAIPLDDRYSGVVIEAL